jgi:hypothetical protein
MDSALSLRAIIYKLEFSAGVKFNYVPVRTLIADVKLDAISSDFTASDYTLVCH